MLNLIFLNWVLVDPIRPTTFVNNVKQLFFKNPIFGAFQKICDWIWKYLQIHQSL